MYKVLYALFFCLIISGCASQRNLQTEIGGHCVSTKVVAGDFVQDHKYRVQWVGGNSSNCPDKATPNHAKIVYPEEFMTPSVFKQMVEVNEVSWGKVILLAQVGMTPLAGIEANKDNVRDCLLDNNYRSLGCLDKNKSDDIYVNGYYRKDGTYVQGHYRTRSNGSKEDNYSYRGNVNPYTGKVGSQP